ARLTRKTMAGWAAIGLSGVVLLGPALLPTTARLDPGLLLGTAHAQAGRLWLGTDMWGTRFEISLAPALLASGRGAVAGSVGVILGALLLGTFEANLRARAGKLAVQVFTLGAMAMPDVTLIMTVYSALPRQTSALVFNLVILGLVGGLWVPATSRLIA